MNLAFNYAVRTEYRNGGFLVRIYEDGTKIRIPLESKRPSFPESIDLKITNCCHNQCPYCYESSTENGKHGDIDIILSRLSDLPPGVEICLGGGCVFEHPHFMDFIETLKHKFILNVTVNCRSLHNADNLRLLQRLSDAGCICGIGLSLVPGFDTTRIRGLNNLAGHFILGVHRWATIRDATVIGSGCLTRIVLLGYKTGLGTRADEWYEENRKTIVANINELRNVLVDKNPFDGRVIVAFDNLALQQLGATEWINYKRLYMGDDGEFTMYYDGVDDKFAIASSSKVKYDADEYGTAVNFFKMKELKENG